MTDIRGLAGARPKGTRAQQIVGGYVSSEQPAPASFSDPVYVVIPSHSSEISYPLPWEASHGNTLPVPGTAVRVGYDETGSASVLSWDGPTANGASVAMITPSQFSPGSDATAAVNAAAAAALANGVDLWVDALYSCYGAVEINGVNVRSLGRRCGLNFPNDPGSSMAGVSIEDTSGSSVPLIFACPVIGHASVSPGLCSWNGYGIEVVGNATVKFMDGLSTGFKAGQAWNNNLGHISNHRWNSTGNLYGAYVLSDTSDFYVEDSFFNGNGLAGMACPATVGISALQVVRSHWGFQPFGFLMEAGASGNTFTPFLSDSVLNQCRFEAMGNGAIVCLATFDSGDKVNTGDLFLFDSGANYGSAYHTSSFTDEFWIDLAVPTGLISIDGGIAGYPVGTSGEAASVGAIRVQQGNSIIVVRGDTAIAGADIVAVTGSQGVLQGTAPVLQGSTPTFNGMFVVGASGDSAIVLGTNVCEIDFNSSDRRIYADAGSVNVDTDGVFEVRDASNSDAALLKLVSKTGGGGAPQLGLFGVTPVAQPTVTGSRSSGAALTSLLTALADLGVIVNSTTT